jgi:hypothetical protein
LYAWDGSRRSLLLGRGQFGFISSDYGVFDDDSHLWWLGAIRHSRFQLEPVYQRHARSNAGSSGCLFGEYLDGLHDGWKNGCGQQLQQFRREHWE